MVSLRKTAEMKAPHATYKAGGWEWRVLKVNQPSKAPGAPYSTWMVAARSPMTFGSWEMGDTYSIEVLRFGELVEATDEFRAYLLKHKEEAA